MANFNKYRYSSLPDSIKYYRYNEEVSREERDRKLRSMKSNKGNQNETHDNELTTYLENWIKTNVEAYDEYNPLHTSNSLRLIFNSTNLHNYSVTNEQFKYTMSTLGYEPQNSVDEFWVFKIVLKPHLEMLYVNSMVNTEINLNNHFDN